MPNVVSEDYPIVRGCKVQLLLISFSGHAGLGRRQHIDTSKPEGFHEFFEYCILVNV